MKQRGERILIPILLIIICAGSVLAVANISSSQQNNPELIIENKTVSENETVNLSVANETYTLNVFEITNNSIKLNFSYNGLEKEMSVGDKVSYEIKDFIVTISLEKIENNKSIFNVLTSKKPFEFTTPIISLIISSIILIILIALEFLRYKKKAKSKDIKDNS